MRINYARAVMDDLKVAVAPVLDQSGAVVQGGERWFKVYEAARRGGASASSAAWMARVFREFEDVVGHDAIWWHRLTQRAAQGDQAAAQEFLAAADAIGFDLRSALGAQFGRLASDTRNGEARAAAWNEAEHAVKGKVDRKSTRLNSSHSQQSRMPSSA